MAFFVVSPRFSETTVLLFVAELGPVDFPLLPCIVLFVASPPSEEACCATAPNGAASKLAANTIDREIEVITDILSSLSRLCGDTRSNVAEPSLFCIPQCSTRRIELLVGIKTAQVAPGAARGSG
jgi:hypothetical protein